MLRPALSFYFTFVDKLSSPTELGPGYYLRILLKGGWSAINSTAFLVFGAVAGLALYRVRRLFRAYAFCFRRQCGERRILRRMNNE